MANVTPGYTFLGTSDPITFTKLNFLSQPTVTLGAGEVISANLAANLAFSGLSLVTSTPFIGATSTDVFSAAISLGVSTLYGNTHLIACTAATGSTLTPAGAGVAGQHLWIVFSTDGTGGNVITYASPFKSIGTHTLTGANKKFTSHFVSDGTNFCEVARSAALS